MKRGTGPRERAAAAHRNAAHCDAWLPDASARLGASCRLQLLSRFTSSPAFIASWHSVLPAACTAARLRLAGEACRSVAHLVDVQEIDALAVTPKHQLARVVVLQQQRRVRAHTAKHALKRLARAKHQATQAECKQQAHATRHEKRARARQTAAFRPLRRVPPQRSRLAHGSCAFCSHSRAWHGATHLMQRAAQGRARMT